MLQLKIEKKAGDSALISMTQNVQSRLDVKQRKRTWIVFMPPPSPDSGVAAVYSPLDDIPEALFRQMTTCQTAANEFLRQFWLAIYPPANESQQLAVATPAQKAVKASKMISYLGKTHEKVEALVLEAQREQFDPARVRVVSDWSRTLFTLGAIAGVALTLLYVSFCRR